MQVTAEARRNHPPGRLRFDSAAAWSVGLVTLGILAWIVSGITMPAMDRGPGTPLHGYPAFVMSWVLMLTAMMLPTELIYIRVFAQLLGNRARDRDRTPYVVLFIAGYLLAWIGYGTIAFGLDAAARWAAFSSVAWNREGPLLAGSVLVLAAAFQVSPLKRACLTHCRSPLAFYARYWRFGLRGSLWMGFGHGLICVACCWALMAVMFAVGAMNLVWMALLTALMFAEKILPYGQRLAVPSAALLMTMGLWIAIAPGSVPFLTNPLALGNDHGPARTTDIAASAESVHALVGEQAPSFALADVQGLRVSFSDLNRHGPIVIVFYYGYRCSHCVGQLFGLSAAIPQFRQRGVTVVAVGPDAPQRTAIKFRRYGAFEYPVLADVDRSTARAYGVYTEATASRPVLEQHGTFLVDRDGVVVWAHTGSEPFTDISALLARIDDLPR